MELVVRSLVDAYYEALPANDKSIGSVNTQRTYSSPPSHRR